MKKTIIFILSFVLFMPVVWAATIVSEYETVVDQNEEREIAPVIITSTSDGDITAKHGIRILINPDEQVLWGESTLGITGTAISNSKVNLNVKSEYAADHKSIYFPVMKDFEAGDWLSIQGLVLRGYDESFNSQKLGLDLDGDMMPDVEDINLYRVGSDVKNDTVAPFAVQNAQSTLNADGSVTLLWSQPPDYDYDGTIIDRTRVKNGFSQTATVYNGFVSMFTDDDLSGVTAVTYKLIARDDAGNQSKPVVLALNFAAESEEPIDVLPETPSTPETETEELSRLLNYYNVRYSVKCLPSGVPAAENNSACLWARIDLIYAQQKTGDELVANLILSDRDLELMAARRQWPEKRYETYCTLSETPASYCPALKKALDRISYFLD